MSRFHLPATSAALLLTVLIGSFVHAQDAPELHTFDSRFYQIHTNLQRDEVVAYARHMDIVYNAFQQRFTAFRDRRQVGRPLYLLRTREDYIRFMASQGIEATNSGGMFFVRQDITGLATWVERADRSHALGTLRHEAFHQFAHNFIGRQLPTSINEGVAEYFEAALVVNGRMRTGLASRRRIEQVKGLIEDGRAVPLDTLLTISGEEWSATLRSNPQASRDLYAQSWSLVHFLVHGDGGRYQQAFENYLLELSKGFTPRQAMRRAFQVDDFSVAEQAWAKFVMQMKPDPVTTAQSHMEFLAAGMLHLQSAGGPMPTTLNELRDALSQRRFAMTHRSHAGEFRYEVSDAQVFQYEHQPEQWEDLQMLAPAQEGLPPRLTTPKLPLRPTLTWSKDEQGNLVHDFVYR